MGNTFLFIYDKIEVSRREHLKYGYAENWIFLSELRKENNLTQEALGEKIGVTNKTISRWEYGNYIPPIEMLQILSKMYDDSINEILSGERLDDEKFKTKAEENIATALENSTFDLKEKKMIFEKKWFFALQTSYSFALLRLANTNDNTLSSTATAVMIIHKTTQSMLITVDSSPNAP